MRIAPEPSISASEAFDLCVAGARDAEWAGRVRGAKDALMDKATVYFEVAQAGNWSDRVRIQSLRGATPTKEDLLELYSATTGRAGGLRLRRVLLGAEIDRACPYCSYGRVTTLDHVLPKAHYPSLCAVPHNLVPACMQCNRDKLDSDPLVGQYPFHPYFDTIPDGVEVECSVHEGAIWGFTFSLRGPNESEQFQRLKMHFAQCHIAATWAVAASEQFSAHQYALRERAMTMGVDGLRQQLDWLADMFSPADSSPQLTWHRPFYEALVGRADGLHNLLVSRSA